MAAGDDWREVEVRVDPAELDLLSGALWAAGAAGVSEYETDGATRLVVAASATELEAVLAVLGERTFEVRPVAADAGLDAWRDHAEPVVVGELTIHPAWVDGGAFDDRTVHIDPGRAFGSGTHVTTRLALELVQDHLLVGDRVLDIGTGSGVLAVAAARLGAGTVIAIDIDPAAVVAARQNVMRNDVTSTVTVTDASPAALDTSFDLVIANITAVTLLSMREVVLGMMATNGRIVLSGILVTQIDDVIGAYDALNVVDRRDEGDWVAFEAVRRA